MTKKFSLKENQMYGNWQVFHPDGFLMFRCNEKRANWYLSRDLAEVIEENCIKLSFIPNGNGHVHEEFYLEPRENKCVVCGTEEDLTKHHTVPICFRRHFSDVLKSKSSHDVVPVCIPCHRAYETHAWEFKKELGNKYGINIDGNSEEHKELIAEERDSSQAFTFANTLLKWKEKIPADRRMEMLAFISPYLGKEKAQIQYEDLLLFLQSRVKRKFGAKDYKFGREIVLKVEDIEEFIKMWRLHFIDIMKPKFMPKLWDVNYFPKRHMKEKNEQN